MYYFIFNSDNGYSWHGTEAPASIMVDSTAGQFTVILPDSCWDDIPADELTNIYYDADAGNIALDVDNFVLPSERAEADLERQLREYMLIPEEERDEWYYTLIDMARYFLPDSLITSITEDGILSDTEAQQILDYLDD